MCTIVALDESNYDDMEMLGWICNRHGGGTKQLSDYSDCQVLEVFLVAFDDVHIVFYT